MIAAILCSISAAVWWSAGWYWLLFGGTDRVWKSARSLTLIAFVAQLVAAWQT